MPKLSETAELRLEKKLDRITELLEYLVILKLHCDGNLNQIQISKRIKKASVTVNAMLKDVEKRKV